MQCPNLREALFHLGTELAAQYLIFQLTLPIFPMETFRSPSTMGNTSISAKSALTVAAPAAPLTIPFSDKWRMNKGRLKITLGLSVLLVGGYGLFSEQNFVSSSNAVVATSVDDSKVFQVLLIDSRIFDVAQVLSLAHVQIDSRWKLLNQPVNAYRTSVLTATTEGIVDSRTCAFEGRV